MVSFESRLLAWFANPWIDGYLSILGRKYIYLHNQLTIIIYYSRKVYLKKVKNRTTGFSLFHLHGGEPSNKMQRIFVWMAPLQIVNKFLLPSTKNNIAK
jgi:hypothetical protein